MARKSPINSQYSRDDSYDNLGLPADAVPSLWPISGSEPAAKAPNGEPQMAGDLLASEARIPKLADYLVHGYWNTPGVKGYWRSWADPTNISVNIEDLTTAERAIALQALNLWDDVCEVTFTFTTGGSDITFYNDGSNSASCGSKVSGGHSLVHSTINISSDWAGGAGTGIYSYFFKSYVHEIGHALGLGHQGPYNGSATYGIDNIFVNDTWRWSVMSYFDQDDPGTGDTRDFVLTPQMADIYAVQSIYGARAMRPGDTTYGFNSTAGSFYDFASYTGTPAFTFYDSDGIDTFDASGYANNQTINLTPGSWSSIGRHINNIGIYLTTTIENAKGGSGADTIIGNAAANILIGNVGDDTLDGDLGDDTLNGGLGNDSLRGREGNDVLYGEDGNDELFGRENNDSLYGGAGEDGLSGGDGDDTLDGGADNDTARYASATAGVTANLAIVGPQDTGGAGIDTLSSIENLLGSEFDDVLSGNAGANVLDGDKGNDTLDGDLGDDTLDGGLGNDSLRGREGNDVLYGDKGVDELFGREGNDRLDGGVGNDSLSGGDGDDSLDGGDGKDTARYASALARVTVSLAIAGAQDTGAAGSDTLIRIENLFGSKFADILTGDFQANILSSNGGNDTLTGSGGNDTFQFDTPLVAGEFATITDFAPGADRFALASLVFTQAGAVGPLAADAFFIGEAAHDASDRIIYNADTGAVLYDADGTGGQAATQFAAVPPGLALSNGDFKII